MVKKFLKDQLVRKWLKIAGNVFKGLDDLVPFHHFGTYFEHLVPIVKDFLSRFF